MQTIEIQTAQNVVIEYEPASLRERVLAFFIDLLILIATYLVLLMGILSIPWGREMAGSGFGANLLFFFFPVAMFLGYHFLSETFGGGQSWGKKAMGIRVMRLDGREPQAQDYLLRAFFHLLETLNCAGILAALLISSTQRNQRLGDMSAHTIVVRLRHMLRFRLEDILNINSLEDYTPVYPQAAQLSERDMLTVKNALARYQQFRNPAHRQALEELGARLAELLQIREPIQEPAGFLKQLLRDYIVLTR